MGGIVSVGGEGMAWESGRAAGAGRRWRRLLVALAAVLVVLVLLDRLAAAVTERALAGRLQTVEHLSSRPSVTIGGFPFLTQLLAGRYRQIDLRARPLERDGVRISSVTVRLSGVSVRLTDALAGRVQRVPIRHGAGTADLSYRDLTGLVHRDGGLVGALLTVSAAGPGRMLISGPAGLSLHAGVTISGARLTLTPARRTSPGCRRCSPPRSPPYCPRRCHCQPCRSVPGSAAAPWTTAACTCSPPQTGRSCRPVEAPTTPGPEEPAVRTAAGG